MNGANEARPIDQWARWPAEATDLGRLWAALLAGNRPQVHPGLTFQKFAQVIARNRFREARSNPRPPRTISECKKPTLDRLAEIYENWRTTEAAMMADLGERSSRAAETLAHATSGEVIQIEADLRWRLTSRLGEAHPFESGFMFHPLFGVPYLPGTGFKGAARFSYWARFVAEASSDDAATARDVMRWLFGSDDPQLDEGDDEDAEREANHRRGLATFFDVFAPADARLEVDVLNPHFPKWYRGTGIETDDQDPVPTFFLTVSSASAWRFAVVLAPAAGIEPAAMSICRERLREAVGDALTVWGLGAKTAAGYGLFEFREPSGRATVERETCAPGAAPPDDLTARIQAFRLQDMGQLRQLIEQIERRPDCAALFEALAVTINALCAGNKRRLKQFRAAHDALAAYLK